MEMDSTAAYKEHKRQQISWYRDEAQRYKSLSRRYLVLQTVFVLFALGIISIPVSIIFLEIYYRIEFSLNTLMLLSAIFLVSVVLSMIFSRLRRNSNKANTLLTQLSDAIEGELQQVSDLDVMKERVQSIEVKFLGNDDELMTKQHVWPYYMRYLQEKDAAFDSKTVPFPTVPEHKLWLTKAPVHTTYKDRKMILPCWEIRLKLQRLRRAFGYFSKFTILNEATELANKNQIVRERFFRHKKISKIIKPFKRSTNVNYMTPAAKMRLISFVDSILSIQPYKEVTEETTLLLADKNEQIQKYTDDFWVVHKRSLRYYLIEGLWLLWMIPTAILSWYAFSTFGGLVAGIVFFIGTGIVTFGEMYLVTRQMIDIRGKKLMPVLIGSLISIRHSMGEYENEEDKAEKYEQYFKNAEKHFIMTTHEIDSVKYVQDNLRTKLERKLSDEVFVFAEQKQKQLHAYYLKFHEHRRTCLKHGAIEAFGALLVIPLFMSGLWALMPVAFIAYCVLYGVTLAFLVSNHIKHFHSKELYLLLYQELATMLDDPILLQDAEKLNKLFVETEQSALEAAKIGKLNKVQQYIETTIENTELLSY